MSYRDILLHLPKPATAEPVLAAAAALAHGHGAHLTGLYVYDLAWPLMAGDGAYLDAAAIQRVMIEAEAAALAQAATLRARFDEVLRREGLPGEWRQVEGRRGSTLATHARYADLAIFARSTDDDDEADLAEDVLFASGRPVLVLPLVLPRPFAIERILVGWNDTREASRAVADAMPVLRRANNVHVLTVGTLARGDRDSRIDAEDLARHLARHGLEITAETVMADLLTVDQVLLNTAAETGADLLVVGGYGHGRLREMVLGGVTRRLLRQAPLPVLLSH